MEKIQGAMRGFSPEPVETNPEDNLRQELEVFAGQPFVATFEAAGGSAQHQFQCAGISGGYLFFVFSRVGSNRTSHSIKKQLMRAGATWGGKAYVFMSDDQFEGFWLLANHSPAHLPTPHRIENIILQSWSQDYF